MLRMALPQVAYLVVYGNLPSADQLARWEEAVRGFLCHLLPMPCGDGTEQKRSSSSGSSCIRKLMVAPLVETLAAPPLPFHTHMPCFVFVPLRR